MKTSIGWAVHTGAHGFEEMFVSRYRFVSVLLMCLAYLFSLLLTKGTVRKVILATFLPITMLPYAYSYYFWHDYNVYYRERLTEATFNFKFYSSWVLHPFDYDWTQQVDEVNFEAIKTGVYQLPTMPFTKSQEEINKDTVHDVSDLALTLEQRKDRFILKIKRYRLKTPWELNKILC